MVDAGIVTIITIIAFTVGVLGLTFGALCYNELRKWVRQVRGARIAVAYKRRVQLQAPLSEWLGWCNQLDRDKDSTGRVIYRQGAVTVAIVKRPLGRASMLPLNWRRKQRVAPPPRTGNWTSQDDTVRT